MEESCKTCKFFCAVKKFPTYQEVLTHVCLLDVTVYNNKDYICEVSENDMCECYTKE